MPPPSSGRAVAPGLSPVKAMPAEARGVPEADFRDTGEGAQDPQDRPWTEPSANSACRLVATSTSRHAAAPALRGGPHVRRLSTGRGSPLIPRRLVPPDRSAVLTTYRLSARGISPMVRRTRP